MPQLDLQALSDESPWHKSLNLSIERTEAGVILRADVDALYSTGGERKVLHGGMVATLLDSAATFAVIGQTDRDWVTVDFRVDYLRPTPVGSVSITGEVLRAGRSIGRARATLSDGEGRVCAVATGTFVPAGQPAPGGEVR